MLSKVYNILPSFLQQTVVRIHRGLRLCNYRLAGLKTRKACAGKDFVAFDGFNKSRKYGPLPKICYAPYKSMFFSRAGLVSPCYASYNDKSSHISLKSIKEIWTAGSFKTIRNEHEVCNLNSTCKFCKTIMDTGSYGSLLINKYEHYAFVKTDFPAIMEFELSNRCNLSCIMCDSNLSSGIEKDNCGAISGNEFYGEKFFKELEEFIPHLQLAEFTGGDPFMIEEYYRIWDMIVQLNPDCQILITTNANTMNARIEKLLSEHKNIHFNVSIDSLQSQNYENIRRNGNFETAMRNLDIFIDYTRRNKTSLNILVCPMTVNVSEMNDFVRFANSKEICVYFHTVVKPKELSLKFADAKFVINSIESMEKEVFSQKSKAEKVNNTNFRNLLNLLRVWASESEEQNLPEKELFKIDEARDLLRLRVQSNLSESTEKFEILLQKIAQMDCSEFILNKLLEIRDDDFFSHLKNDSIEELEVICKGLIPDKK